MKWTKLDPMKPEPPVTRRCLVMVISQSSSRFITSARFSLQSGMGPSRAPVLDRSRTLYAGGTREVRGGAGLDTALRVDARGDLAGELEPGALAAVGQMVEARRGILLD